ncbi:mitochondrial 54S ribosomal protein YmL31 [Apiospora rasikravindrae]|uniref:Mitochondrial 54S ribosomal protein YmL31 n=1 Tax=Apiospora rasikravindrae TaxID=990691 RepID=A0ABR1UAX0_9PEZI
MFGAFRFTNPLSGGLLWKTPWRLSRFQKTRQRRRLRAVDSVVATIDAALAKQGQTLTALDTWKEKMPTEAEMLPKDKYTIFDRKEKRYRKGIHKLPKWTRVSQRLNPLDTKRRSVGVAGRYSTLRIVQSLRGEADVNESAWGPMGGLPRRLGDFVQYCNSSFRLL